MPVSSFVAAQVNMPMKICKWKALISVLAVLPVALVLFSIVRVRAAEDGGAASGA